MRFKKHDGTYFELKVKETKPSFLINFELLPTSSGEFISIDRGVSTDRYSAVFSFTQPKAYIEELITELKLLRDNKEEVIIDDFDEPVFAENINHQVPIKCLVYKMGRQEGTDLQVQNLDIEFLATDIVYDGSATIPPTINCVSTSYKGYSIWNTHINESYNRDNWFIDREADTFEFEGEYFFTVEENQSLLNFWKNQRGESFNINDGDFGTSFMFGASAGNGVHKVIITDISYKYISPLHRQTLIKLVKVK